MLDIFYLQISYESYVFSQNCYLISFFIASNTKQSKKKRKPGKSPEKERENDKEVASVSINSSIASKTGPKKAKFKKSGNNSTGAYSLHM